MGSGYRWVFWILIIFSKKAMIVSTPGGLTGSRKLKSAQVVPGNDPEPPQTR